VLRRKRDILKEAARHAEHPLQRRPGGAQFGTNDRRAGAPGRTPAHARCALCGKLSHSGIPPGWRPMCQIVIINHR
jgi:hypothetical protein